MFKSTFKQIVAKLNLNCANIINYRIKGQQNRRIHRICISYAKILIKCWFFKLANLIDDTNAWTTNIVDQIDKTDESIDELSHFQLKKMH